MVKKDIEKKVFELAKPIVEQLEYSLVDVELSKDFGELFLRIIIDKSSGINLTDCSNVSKKLKNILDETLNEDFYDYFEVSSPGLDRTLEKDRDFKIFKGRKVKITFSKNHDGIKFIDGILEGLDDNNNINIIVNNDILTYSRNNIKTIRLNEF